MSARAVLKEAAACGFRLSLNGGNLALKASAKPSAALLAKLKAHKAEIVALLRQETALDRPPEPGEVEVEERKGMALRTPCRRPI